MEIAQIPLGQVAVGDRGRWPHSLATGRPCTTPKPLVGLRKGLAGRECLSEGILVIQNGEANTLGLLSEEGQAE